MKISVNFTKPKSHNDYDRTVIVNDVETYDCFEGIITITTKDGTTWHFVERNVQFITVTKE